MICVKGQIQTLVLALARIVEKCLLILFFIASPSLIHSPMDFLERAVTSLNCGQCSIYLSATHGNDWDLTLESSPNHCYGQIFVVWACTVIWMWWSLELPVFELVFQPVMPFENWLWAYIACILQDNKLNAFWKFLVKLPLRTFKARHFGTLLESHCL